MNPTQLVNTPGADAGRRRSCLSCGAAGVSYAANDVVITTTGDRLVGEIKKVEKDVLTLSTDYSDSDFKIKWEKIASIESDRQFIVETFDGHRLSGSLKRGTEKKAAVQVADTSVPLREIVGRAAVRAVFLVPVRRGLRSRLQHDARELGQAVLVRGESLVPRSSSISTPCSPTSSGVRRRMLPTRTAGSWGTTSGASSANAGTSTPRRTS